MKALKVLKFLLVVSLALQGLAFVLLIVMFAVLAPHNNVTLPTAVVTGGLLTLGLTSIASLVLGLVTGVAHVGWAALKKREFHWDVVIYVLVGLAIFWGFWALIRTV